MTSARLAPGVLQLRIEDPDQPGVSGLLQMADGYFESLYPREQNHLLDIGALRAADVTFLVARQDDRIVGCAAIRYHGQDYAEIKRMFVIPEARGRGIGRHLIEQLQRMAVESGYSLLRLETGRKQAEAISLYRAAGFVERGPFGAYPDSPMSLFLEKRLD
jgi:putative acetyltransferase